MSESQEREVGGGGVFKLLSTKAIALMVDRYVRVLPGVNNMISLCQNRCHLILYV